MQAEIQERVFSKKDLITGTSVGFLVGLLMLPVLKAAKPALFDAVAISLIPFFTIATPLGLLVAYYISKKIALVWQLAKFGVIGVLNTLVDLGILQYLIFAFREYFGIVPEQEFSFPFFYAISLYTIYKSFSFVAANVNSYYWNKYWTFENRSEENNKSGFLSFFLISLVGFFLNVLIASYIFNSINPMAGMNSDQWGLIGAMAGTVSGLAWNFVGYKFIVFKK